MAKVLIVDDSLSVRKVVERALDAKQIEVLSAASGSEAIDRIERDQPDLVVCDVVMPDRDGYEVCDFVKRHPRLGRTPVLLISGIVNDAVLSQAARVQSDDVISKPFAAEDLMTKIDGLLSKLRDGGPAGDGAGRPAPESPPGAADTAAPALRPTPVPPAARVPASPAVTARTEPSPLPEGLKQILEELIATTGAPLAAVVDRQGFPIESAGEAAIDVEAAGALASCLSEASDGIGRELGQGELRGLLVEFGTGTVLLHPVGASAILVAVMRDPATLGKTRYYARKALPRVLQAL